METIPEELKHVVHTKDGPVCGIIDKRENSSYFMFRSIPYAKPPVGCLRFLPPCPVAPWSEILDCTQESNQSLCYIKDELVGSEDCLYLEVTTPDVTAKEPLPVMFWIGCYGFSTSIDQLFDPLLLNDQNIVFVRCSFRLGVFGFLSINDFMAPGNCGLKDVVMALKWVQRNISAFGGDPNNVTIFGSSMGGTIVHLLMLSPMAAGLFHKAIVQSASALNYSSLTKNPFQPVMELAKQLNITKICNTDIIEELRSISAQDIMMAYYILQKEKDEANEPHHMDSLFKPCIEQDLEGQPAFLTKSPLVILKCGNYNKVPLIIGSNNIEASVLQIINKNFYDFEKYNKNLQLIVPKNLAGEAKMSKRIAQQLMNFYLDGEEFFRQDTKSQFIQMVSDYFFLYYVYKTVQWHSQHAPEYPIYYYIVNQAGEWYVPEDLQYFNTLGHCAELPFIFGLKDQNNEKRIFKGSRDSIRTRARVIRMWTNFAKYGNPTPDEQDPLLQIKWDPVETPDKLNYLSIGSELTKGRNPFQERMNFWDELHKEHLFLRALVHINDMGVTC